MKGFEVFPYLYDKHFDLFNESLFHPFIPSGETRVHPNVVALDDMVSGATAKDVGGGYYTPTGLRLKYSLQYNETFNKGLFSESVLPQTYRVMVYITSEADFNGGDIPLTDLVSNSYDPSRPYGTFSVLNDLGDNFYGDNPWICVYDKFWNVHDVRNRTNVNLFSMAHYIDVPEVHGTLTQSESTALSMYPFNGNGPVPYVWGVNAPGGVGPITIPGAAGIIGNDFPSYVQGAVGTVHPYVPLVFNSVTEAHSLYERETAIGGTFQRNSAVDSVQTYCEDVLIDLSEYCRDVSYVVGSKHVYVAFFGTGIIDDADSCYFMCNWNSRLYFRDSTRQLKK